MGDALEIHEVPLGFRLQFPNTSQFPNAFLEIAESPSWCFNHPMRHAVLSTFLFTAILGLGFIGFVNPVGASNRGLVVELRASEAANAPIEKSVKLYSASYALVIGNDDYQHWPKLSNAIKDARLVGKELETHGFEVTYRTNLTGDELEEALEEFYIEKGADIEARRLVWFAGHGETVDGIRRNWGIYLGQSENNNRIFTLLD